MSDPGVTAVAEVVPDMPLFEYPPEFPVIDGVVYYPGVTREYLHCIRGLPVDQRDVVVGAYPKSGQTWVSEKILWQIFNNGEIDTRQMAFRTPFLEAYLCMRKAIYHKEESVTLEDFVRSRQPPRIFKTHLQYQLVPVGDGVRRPKYIYVMRNPKDVAVSFYHHTRRFKCYKFNGSFEIFFENFIRGKVECGSYFDHILSWWMHREDDNILFLKYEDVKKDLKGAVAKIAAFVGKNLNEGMVTKITQQTEFEAMKGGKQFYQCHDDWEINPESARFMRKGEVGDWRSVFTEEQSHRFDELCAKRFKGSGLELTFQ